jgi:hypothetical protein
MQSKFLTLAPLLVVMAGTAFADGADDKTQAPPSREMAVLCADTGTGTDLVLNAACKNVRKPLRVAVGSAEPKLRRHPHAKRITRMPWQIGIFQ